MITLMCDFSHLIRHLRPIHVIVKGLFEQFLIRGAAAVDEDVVGYNLMQNNDLCIIYFCAYSFSSKLCVIILNFRTN